MRVFIVAVAPGLANDPGLCRTMFRRSTFPSAFAEKDSELLRHKLPQEFLIQLNYVDFLFSSDSKGVCLPVNLCSVSKAENDTVCVPINA